VQEALERSYKLISTYGAVMIISGWSTIAPSSPRARRVERLL
jgi:hypothetical protein